MAVSAGVGYSDNVARSNLNHRDESIAEAALQLAVDQKSDRLDANVTADVAYNKYLRNTFDDEVVGNLNGAAVLRVIQDRMNWTVQENFGQTRRDPFAVVTPDNRENINYFSTGPDFLFRIPGSNQLALSARYARMDYEKSLLDSTRYSGSISLSHEISSASALAAYVQSEKVDFADGVSIADYDRQGAFLRYSLQGGRTQATLDGGVDRIDRQGTKTDGSLVRLKINRSLGLRSQLSLTLGRELTDSGNEFGTQLGVISGGPNTSSLAQTAAPYTSQYASLGFDTAGRLTQLGLFALYAEEDYEQALSSDRNRLEASFYVGRSLGGGWSARLTGRLDMIDYRGVATDYRETSLVAMLSRRAGRDLHIDLSAERYDRHSDVAITEYAENRVWLKIRYGEVSSSPLRTLDSRPAQR